MMTTAALMQKITEARSAMILSQPFFGVLALRLRVVIDNDRTDTMATDGVHLVCNSDYVENESPAVLRTTIAHETMHCAHKHHVRRGKRDGERWNDACDFMINPKLVAAGFTLWDGALLDPRHVGKSAEAIYADLTREAAERQQQEQQQQQDQNGQQQQPGGGAAQPAPQGQQQPGQQPSGQQPQQQPGGQPQGQPSGQPGGQQPQPGGQQQPGTSPGQPSSAPSSPSQPPRQPGQVLDAPRLDGTEGVPTEADLTDQDREWTIAVTQAAQAAKAAGKLPGWLQQEVDEIREPKLDWREKLRRFMTSTLRSETTWSRPNRRFAGSGLFLPGTKSIGMGEIVLAEDTSASTARFRAMFMAEFNALLEEVEPERVHVVYCDMRVAGTETFTREDYPVKLKNLGGGGTAFKPVFDWIEEQGINPVALIYLTDLEGSLDFDEPPYPVLWAVGGEEDDAPFGEVVRIDA